MNEGRGKDYVVSCMAPMDIRSDNLCYRRAAEYKMVLLALESAFRELQEANINLTRVLVEPNNQYMVFDIRVWGEVGVHKK